MKAVLSAIALIVILSLTTVAQNAPTPSLVASHYAGAAAAKGDTFSWGPAPSGANILFYGGDVNPSDPNVQGFVNGNTLLVPNTTTYGAVQVPAAGHFVVTGVFFNQAVNGTGGNIFDPSIGTYDFRIGVSSGNGGTSIASGSGPQSASATGRMPFGLVEYKTSVALASPMTATNGETVWVNESPQCTDNSDAACQGQYFIDNTTQKTGSVNGEAQPTGQMFLTSAYFGYTWYDWCGPTLGQNAQQCADMSFGIYGHR